MIEIKNIHKLYNLGEVTESCIFDDFSLDIKKNEFLSIVGSNGSGKTTLLNIICGSIPIEHGSIILDGKDITKWPEFKRMKKIGRVYQNPALGTCPSLNIIENLSLAENKDRSFNLLPLIDNNRIDYYREMLKSLNLGLEDKMYVKVGALSGGQRQAIALLMTTLNDIDFLILDEHTAALDPKTADIIMEITNDVVKKKNITTIMVTHNLRYAVEYGNRIVMLHQGKNIFDKSGKEKEDLKVDDILSLFTSISIECGN